jgi:hypothetical protein
VVFDDPASAANNGLILVATMTARLRLEALIPAGARAGSSPTMVVRGVLAATISVRDHPADAGGG